MRRSCSSPTFTAAARLRTSTAPGRCSTRRSVRASAASCSTSSVATQLCSPPGPTMLQELTRVPVIGVMPWLQHGLPDEDGAGRPAPNLRLQRVAVVRYPTASNLDEFRLLEQVAQIVWAQTAAELDGAALVILPGSKHVARDLAWLRHTGLDAAITARAARGERVLAICGGLQLLGERIDDP